MIQEQTLSKIILDKDPSIITLNNLSDEYFSDYKAEYNFVKKHIELYGNVPDAETFLDTFPDFELLQVNESVPYLLQTLTEDRTRRFLVENFNEMRPLLMNNDMDAAISTFKKAVDKVDEIKTMSAVDLLHDLSRFDAYEDKINNKDKYFISTGFTELDDITGGWDVNEDLVTIVARNGLGKCLEKGTKVLMADGTLKKVEDVKVGDKVQSLNRINNVLALHNGRSNGYKIIPTLGDPFTVSSNHILTLYRRNDLLRKGDTLHTTDNTFTLVDISIEDYLKLSKNQQKKYELYRPSVNYPEKDLKIPPYILGSWLGDGTSCRVSLTNIDNEIIDEWKKWGCQYTDIIREDRNTYDITNPGNKGKTSEVLELFRFYNLLNNKHIPLDYLTGSEKQRLELLAGILDTDGYLAKKLRAKSNTVLCTYSICLKSKILIEQIAQLARGLNFRVGKIKTRTINNKVKGLTNYYTISINGDLARIPSRLPRKKAVTSTSHRNQSKLNLFRFTVEPVAEIEYYGFMCDGDQRYLLWDNTLTHNTWLLLKCAAAAAAQGKRVGLYSGEMSEDSVGYRIDSILGHISNGSLLHGGASVKNQYKDFLNNLKEMPGSLYVITPKMINGPATVSALRAFIEKYKLDILFVDQHSLLEDDKHAKNPVEKAANISKDLKLLQTTKRIPIVCVSQQNREKMEDGKSFDTSQVAQSDRIAQDSSLIIFIERKDDLMKLHLVKSRNTGAGAILSYKVDLNLGYWIYVPEGTEESGSQMVDSNAVAYAADDVF